MPRCRFLISSLLTAEPCTYQSVPHLADIRTTLKLLAGLGGKVEHQRWLDGADDLTLQADAVGKFEAPYDLVKTMRASFLVLGPLVARFGRARVSTPGGCAIGARPINLHLKGLEALGANIEQTHGYVEATAAKLRGAKIYLDLPSVGATENLMMAATLADGTTIIENAAKEPEIDDLANVLNEMGAKVQGAGSDHHTRSTVSTRCTEQATGSFPTASKPAALSSRRRYGRRSAGARRARGTSRCFFDQTQGGRRDV